MLPPAIDPSDLTELPFHLPGRIYRSAMPFGAFDLDGTLFQAYQAAGITGVVVLAEAQECLEKTGRDLLAFYHQHGLEVIHCPILDYCVPEWEPLEAALEALIERARAGKHTAVHCSAGLGRTGVFMACLAHKLLGMDGDSAIAWVRQVIPGAVETAYQEEFIREVAG